jgi:hypothetical protein
MHIFQISLANSIELSPAWEDPVAKLLKNFPIFYGTRRFISVFTRVLHRSLSWARWVQSTPPHTISLVAFFLLAFPPKSYTHSTAPHACYMPFPSQPPWLLFSYCTWRTVQAMKLLIMQFSSVSCHFIPLWSKYSPQPHVLKHPQFVFLP